MLHALIYLFANGAEKVADKAADQPPGGILEVFGRNPLLPILALGAKFGVDLVGGTILVYEIDLRKSAKEFDAKGKKKDEGKDGKKKEGEVRDQAYDPIRDITVLAEALKRRIDPNDLKNVTIRPSG